MISFQRRAALLAKTEAELIEESASSLARVTRKLEELLARHAELAASPDSDPAALAEVRAAAERQRWYLLVQREALGLYDHGEVLLRYPLVPPGAADGGD